MVEDYTRGMSYEILIRRAFKCDRYKHGADVGTLRLLIETERGEPFIKTPIAKQWAEVRKYLGKAFEKFLTYKGLSQEEITILEHLKNSVAIAQTTADITVIIDAGLEITHRLK